MRIMLTGNKGQLGQALTAALPAGTVLLGVDIDEVDIADKVALDAALADFQPDLVINAAAYTDVDGCARDPALAYRANALGPQKPGPRLPGQRRCPASGEHQRSFCRDGTGRLRRVAAGESR